MSLDAQRCDAIMGKLFRPDDSIDAVMRQMPAAVGVLLEHRLACVGCAIAPFHTIEDICAEYGLDAATLISRLRAVDAASKG